MSGIDSLYAVRVVAKDDEEFTQAVGFYRALLGQDPFRQFGEPGSVHQAAFFRIGDLQLVVTCEDGPTPESGIQQGPVWLCFRASDPDAAFSEATERGATLAGPPVATSFGTRAFFANDPTGLAVYTGTGWD